MPERTFGRTIRSRRTKLGLSQAKLGELVGRSASTIRSWERDKTHPTETGVITALAAILGADEQQLFERAGQAVPDVEDSPTIEQALATLSPAAESELAEGADEHSSAEEASPRLNFDDEIGEGLADEQDRSSVHAVAEPSVNTSDVENTVAESAADVLPNASDSDDLFVAIKAEQEESVDQPSDDDEVVEASTYALPAELYVIVAPATASVGSSYLEDRSQRQLYLVRNLATIVALVGLVVALLWALTESLSAIGDWWDEFFGNLRL